MQCKTSNLIKFHEFLNSAVSPHVEGATVVDQSPSLRSTDAWHKEHFEGPISFAVWSVPSDAQAWSDQTGGRPIHKLVGTERKDSAAWVSWSEKWTKKRGRDFFDLVDVGFVFYWGPRTHLDQIFRAEWVAKGVGTDIAGHPHWHCDCSVTGSSLSVKEVHLGMSGWERAGTRSECWQIYPDSTEMILDWAGKALDYSREQLERYPPK